MTQHPSMSEAIIAVRRLATSPDWQTFVDYLVGRFGFQRRTTFVPENSHETAFNEGHRALTQHILLLASALIEEEQMSRSPTGAHNE